MDQGRRFIFFFYFFSMFYKYFLLRMNTFFFRVSLNPQKNHIMARILEILNREFYNFTVGWLLIGSLTLGKGPHQSSIISFSLYFPLSHFMQWTEIYYCIYWLKNVCCNVKDGISLQKVHIGYSTTSVIVPFFSGPKGGTVTSVHCTTI